MPKVVYIGDGHSGDYFIEVRENEFIQIDMDRRIYLSKLSEWGDDILVEPHPVTISLNFMPIDMTFNTIELENTRSETWQRVTKRDRRRMLKRR